MYPLRLTLRATRLAAALLAASWFRVLLPVTLLLLVFPAVLTLGVSAYAGPNLPLAAATLVLGLASALFTPAILVRSEGRATFTSFQAGIEKHVERILTLTFTILLLVIAGHLVPAPVAIGPDAAPQVTPLQIGLFLAGMAALALALADWYRQFGGPDGGQDALPARLAAAASHLRRAFPPLILLMTAGGFAGLLILAMVAGLSATYLPAPAADIVTILLAAPLIHLPGLLFFVCLRAVDDEPSPGT